MIYNLPHLLFNTSGAAITTNIGFLPIFGAGSTSVLALHAEVDGVAMDLVVLLLLRG